MRPWLVAAFALLAPVPAALAAAGESGKPFELSTGTSLYAEVRGEGAGTPLMLVNGGPGFDHSYLHVSDVWDALAGRRRVVFYDQRGNGRSAPLKAGQSCTLADQIADLEALLAALGLQRVDMLGHSWGGYLAMAYAARHPERIAHLVIVDSAAPKWADTLFLFKEIFPETSARQDALAFAVEMGDADAQARDIKEYLSMLFYSPEKRDAFFAKASSYVYKREINQALNQDVARFDLNPELAKFRFPVLVVTGRYDINVAPLVAYRIHKAVPGSRFAVFERSGHLPFFEEPEGFAALLEEFLGH